MNNKELSVWVHLNEIEYRVQENFEKENVLTLISTTREILEGTEKEDFDYSES